MPSTVAWGMPTSEATSPSRLIDALSCHPSVSERTARPQALPRPIPFADLEDDPVAAAWPREAIRASVAAFSVSAAGDSPRRPLEKAKWKPYRDRPPSNAMNR